MNTHVLAQRKSLFWRIHLWAAFLATPFALVGALTGILYIFTPQIEAALHGHLDRVTPVGTPLKLDALVALAQQAAPKGAALRYVVTPEMPDESVRVYFSAAQTKPAAPAGDHARRSGQSRSARRYRAGTADSLPRAGAAR